MEKTGASLPQDVKRTHTKLQETFNGNDTLTGSELDMRDVSRFIAKMPFKSDKNVCESTINAVFKLALDRMESDKDKEVLNGLRQLVREVEDACYVPQPRYKDAFFFPNMANIKKMVGYINKAKKTLDLAIFSFTNDDLANAIIEAHKRGVAVRIITDDEAMKGKGADSQKCSDAGIPVRTDSEERFHMHNKYMIVDSIFIVTGSFNWTFQAGKSNQENVVVVDGDYFIQKYNANFQELWAQFSGNELERKQHKAAVTIQKKYRSNKGKQQEKKKSQNRNDKDAWWNGMN